MCWPLVLPSVGWMCRVDSVFGLWLCQSCGLTTCSGFPLADFVGVGLFCVHVWVCVCSAYVLALGLVKCWLDGCFVWFVLVKFGITLLGLDGR